MKAKQLLVLDNGIDMKTLIQLRGCCRGYPAIAA